MAFLSPSFARPAHPFPRVHRLCLRHRPPSVHVPSSTSMTYSSAASSSPADNSSAPDDSSPSPPFTSVDAEVRAVPLSALKLELYTLLGPANRGLAASPSLRDRVLSLLGELEREHPPQAPVDDPALLTGRWRLVFTDALDVLSLALLAPVASVGQIFQNIYEADQQKERKNGVDYDMETLVELEPAIAPLINTVVGQTVTTLRITAEARRKSETRLDVKFVQTAIRQESVVGFDMPKDLPALRFGMGGQAGYFETTFLDDDLRIARSPPIRKKDGDVYVLIREQ